MCGWDYTSTATSVYQLSVVIGGPVLYAGYRKTRRALGLPDTAVAPVPQGERGPSLRGTGPLLPRAERDRSVPSGAPVAMLDMLPAGQEALPQSERRPAAIPDRYGGGSAAGLPALMDALAREVLPERLARRLRKAPDTEAVTA